MIDIVELAEEVFHMPVRLGYPHGIEGLKDEVNSPSYATTVGLLMHARDHLGAAVIEAGERNGFKDSGSVFSRMKNWFSNSF